MATSIPDKLAVTTFMWLWMPVLVLWLVLMLAIVLCTGCSSPKTMTAVGTGMIGTGAASAGPAEGEIHRLAVEETTDD